MRSRKTISKELAEIQLELGCDYEAAIIERKRQMAKESEIKARLRKQESMESFVELCKEKQWAWNGEQRRIKKVTYQLTDAGWVQTSMYREIADAQ